MQVVSSLHGKTQIKAYHSNIIPSSESTEDGLAMSCECFHFLHVSINTKKVKPHRLTNQSLQATCKAKPDLISVSKSGEYELDRVALEPIPKNPEVQEHFSCDSEILL